jgi:hypothetical protein
MDYSSARTLAVDARSRSWENVSLVHVMFLDKSWVFVGRPGLVQQCRMSLRVPFPVSCEVRCFAQVCNLSPGTPPSRSEEA